MNPKRTECGGCGRRMAVHVQRDYEGRSWHYDCLANATGQMADFYRKQWAIDKPKLRAARRAKEWRKSASVHGTNG
jgi:hypothetical protein